MLNVKSFSFNPFQVNTFVIYNDKKEGLIVDAACYEENEFFMLKAFVEENQLNPIMLINTHGHVDHLTGIKRLKEEYNLPFLLHQEDEFLLEGAVDHGRVFGLETEKPPVPDKYLTEESVFFAGDDRLSVIHVPGHSPGSVLFYNKNARFVIAGDVLFRESIGRTDLPGGNHELLISGIKNKVMSLPGEMLVYPGHGPATSIDYERINNPFLQ